MLVADFRGDVFFFSLSLAVELLCLTDDRVFVGDLSCSLRRLALSGVSNLPAASTVRGS